MSRENSNDDAPHHTDNWALKFGLIGLGCILALVILEIGLRLFWRQELTSWQRNLNVTVPLDPEVTTGVAGPAHIITSSEGIRAAEWSSERSSEYRILAIGESTTECLLQDQPNTWTALLQTKLLTTIDGRSVWVGNAGSGGFTSRHDVLAMRYMLDEYDPDVVIVLLGGNDAGRALNEGANYDPHFIDNNAKMRDLMLDFSEQPTSLLEAGGMSIQDTRLWIFLREFRFRFFDASARGMVENIETIRERQEKRQQASRIIDEMPDLQLALEGYRHNILEMVRLAREHNVHLVFMTQPTFYKADMSPEETNRLWAGWYGDSSLNEYWSPKVWSAAIDAVNGVLLETCRDEGIDCIDLASMLPKSTSIFWDQVHFTDYGSSQVADALAKYFEAYFDRTQKQSTP